ncbi:hypothetical protein CPC08DRAFT_712220 [Agrocybe pediades]|nr:hypothetical protein CPC08DRAFT_712220 [Agrocybe pediades]
MAMRFLFSFAFLASVGLMLSLTANVAQALPMPEIKPSPEIAKVIGFLAGLTNASEMNTTPSLCVVPFPSFITWHQQRPGLSHFSHSDKFDRRFRIQVRSHLLSSLLCPAFWQNSKPDLKRQ